MDSMELGCLLTQPVDEVEKAVEYESGVQGRDEI